MKTKNFFNKIMTMFCCSALLISGLTMSKASADTSIQTLKDENLVNQIKINEKDVFGKLSTEDEMYLEELGLDENNDFFKILIALEELPEEFTEEDTEEIAKWFTQKTGLVISAKGKNLNFESLYDNELANFKQINGNTPTTKKTTISTFSWSGYQALACIGSLGTLIPITKILKINKVLKAAGGAITVMKQVYTNYKYYRKTKKYSRTKAINKAVTDFSVKKKLASGSKALLMDFFNVSLIAGSCGPLFTYENSDKAKNYLFNENTVKNLA